MPRRSGCRRSRSKKLYKVPQTRLNFPSLVAGVRSKNKEAIRQFRDLLLIEWSPPPPTQRSITILDTSDFLRMARLRKKSEAAHLLNEIVHCWLPSRRNTNDLVAVNNEQRIRFVDMCSKEFTSLGLVLAGLWSDQSDLQLFATQKFREVLFDTLCPVNAPFILEFGIVPRLDEFLERKDFSILQTEAALALIDICSTALMYTELWIDLDLLKILLKLLDFPSCDVREKTVLQLGMVAETCEGRDLVHQHEALHPLLDKVLRPLLDESDENDKLLPKLRNATYTLLRFCKGEDKPSKFETEVTENKYGVFIAYKPVVVVSPHLDEHIVDFGALPCLWKLLSKNVEKMEVWTTIRRLTKGNTRRTKATQIEITNSEFHDSVRYEIEGKKKEVNEKLVKYDKEKLWIFCIQLCIPFHTIIVSKEEMVSKLMEFLEGDGATTDELYAEKEQSSEGKKRRRESELEKDAKEESSSGVHKSSVEQMSEVSLSDDELCDAIGEIVREVDFHTVDLIDIMERLRKRFGRDLTPRETYIRIMFEYHITHIRR